MLKKSRFYVGITLLVQSFSFLAVLFMIAAKKKSLANALLVLGTAGGLAGAFLLYKQAQEEKKEAARKVSSAMDACCDCSDDTFQYEEAKEAKSPETTEEIPVEEVVDENEFKEN